jgi:hypothetical protein
MYIHVCHERILELELARDKNKKGKIRKSSPPPENGSDAIQLSRESGMCLNYRHRSNAMYSSGGSVLGGRSPEDEDRRRRPIFGEVHTEGGTIFGVLV